MEFFNPNSNIDFMRWRKISVGIAAVLMLASLVLLGTRGLNYALDFTGGVLVEVEYGEPVEVSEVREALNAGGFDSAIVQSLGGARDIAIRLQAGEGEDGPAADNVGDAVLAALKTQREDVTVIRQDFVGPQVGDELRTDGVVALIFVILGIMIYTAIRFERRFAFAAVASEFNDTLLTIGFFAISGIEFDLTALAALLAVVGYSINDKVVVFDRVRELFTITRNAQPIQILNKAINQTLSRTIITGLTTFFTVGALYAFGGPAVEGFALTMMVGIVVGTLSSIFFACPLLYWLGVSKQDLMPVTKDDPELARRP